MRGGYVRDAARYSGCRIRPTRPTYPIEQPLSLARLWSHLALLWKPSERHGGGLTASPGHSAREANDVIQTNLLK
jgi:hypothetical protein